MEPRECLFAAARERDAGTDWHAKQRGRQLRWSDTDKEFHELARHGRVEGEQLGAAKYMVGGEQLGADGTTQFGLRRASAG